jgi:hypothetical protein
MVTRPITGLTVHYPDGTRVTWKGKGTVREGNVARFGETPLYMVDASMKPEDQVDVRTES